MKRALTIGAVAALIIGVSLPAAAFETDAATVAAFAEPAADAPTLEAQSLDITVAAGAAVSKDAFSAEAAPVVVESSSSYASSSYSGPLPDGFAGIATWPVNAPVNDGFGYRDGGEFHGGIDIMCGYGATIVAVSEGVVTYVGDYGGYGNVVIINHGSGVETYYSHLSVPTISAGTWVSAGTPVGLSGDTGYATVAHLHFELHVNGSKVDPMPYMP
jgi:murein DD-endopeptidase MepM/ murein hydrolase activator NlpD